MKSKIFKIMGVSLALVLVFSLGVAFLPANTPAGPESAEAGTLSWSSVGLPSATGSVLVLANKDLGPVAISPNFATDNTVWACVNDAAGAADPLVYKSTNGGHTWTPTTSTLGGLGVGLAYTAVALKVSPEYASDNTLFVAVIDYPGAAGTSRVYRSTNGGSSFGQLGVVTTGANEVITDMAVSPNYDGTGVVAVSVACITDNVPAAAANSVQVWGSGGTLSWTAYTAAAPTDAMAIEFSPSYAIDSTILAVTWIAAGQPQLRAIVGGVWDSGIATTAVGSAVTLARGFCSTPGTATTVVCADIALPSDYNATVATSRRAYVTLCDGTAAGYTAATGGNVFRITNVTPGTKLDSGAALYPLEYSGDFAEGTLVGGLYNAQGTAADVYRTTNPTLSVVNWYGVAGGANMPTGACGNALNTPTDNTSAWIDMSVNYANDSFVAVGTMGDGSAFGVSFDGAVSFNETGLIDEGANVVLTTVTDAAISPDYANDSTMFMVSECDDGSATNSSVWVSTNGGTYWDRCFDGAFIGAGTGTLACSHEYATDSAVWAAETGAGALNIWYSATGGTSWSARTVGGLTGINTVAAPDANTIYVGDTASGNIGKSANAGWTWPASLRKNSGCSTAVMDLKVADSTVIASGDNGTVRRSDDGSTTWAKVGTTVSTGNNIYVAFDGTTVWATDSATGDLYRSEDGGAWVTCLTTPANAVAMELAPDGTLYWAEAAGGDVYRSIAPTSPEPTPGVSADAMAPPAGAGVALDAATGGSNYVLLLKAAAALRIYTDTQSAGSTAVTLVAPATGYLASGVPGTVNVTFTVEFPTNVTVVTVSIANNADFSDADNTATTITGPAVSDTFDCASLGFPTEGRTLYWRARATTPSTGPWSDVRSFQMPILTAVQAPTPAYPAGDDVMNVPLTPVMNWSAFKAATGYQVQVSKNSDMSDAFIDETLGNTNSYKIADPLSYDSTYYWRVRAVVGTAATYSDWSAIIGFTTMSKPVAPAPPIIIEPTPAPAPAPAPITPAYIYAIIAIGAVLVIVVIVLIVRTRRIP